MAKDPCLAKHVKLAMVILTGVGGLLTGAVLYAGNVASGKADAEDVGKVEERVRKVEEQAARSDERLKNIEQGVERLIRWTDAQKRTDTPRP